MKYKIQANDIPLLAKIFNPSADLVFVLTNLEAVEFYKKIQDKLDCKIQFFTEEIALQIALEEQHQREIILINLTNKLTIDYPTNTFLKLVIIDFGKTRKSLANTIVYSEKKSYGKCFQPVRAGSTKPFRIKSIIVEFDFINNRDNTIRWIYDAKHRKPIFLNLYNASGWKGSLFKTIFKIGFSLKLKKWLKSGRFSVIANQLFLEKINQGLNQAQYAIFTGTVGANRKAVITYEEAGKATQFLKMPLTKKVQELVDKETFYLAELQKYKFEKLVIPLAEKIGNSVMVTNVKPDKSLVNNVLSKNHLLALEELYQQTTAPIFFQAAPMWQTIQADFANIASSEVVNDLSKEKAQNIHAQLNILAERFDGIDTLPMAITHGDLTPWNSYLSEDKLHVYDWELAERLPLLYDAFHYIFQTSILVERLSFVAIKLKLENLEKDPIIQSILSNFEIEFQQAYHFYLLRNTSYYLSRYVQQQNLHIQAHWLVDMWETALKDACNNISIVA